MVHGEQGIELLGEIPPDGEIESVGECSAIWDKGSAAVLEFTSESRDVATGQPLAHKDLAFLSWGRWLGGDRGPSEKLEFPDRSPDKKITYSTREDQALTYRLSGDRNPLHSDPSFAALGGFDKPILHGLCTYGMTGRALLHGLCEGDESIPLPFDER